MQIAADRDEAVLVGGARVRESKDRHMCVKRKT
jgi:hypothetical protein